VTLTAGGACIDARLHKEVADSYHVELVAPALITVTCTRTTVVMRCSER
jgi:hypothetical protein